MKDMELLSVIKRLRMMSKIKKMLTPFANQKPGNFYRSRWGYQ